MIADPDDVDFYEDEGDTSDCHNCHGEGFVAHCFEEWACMYPDEGCDLCMRRCDWCASTSTAVGSVYPKTEDTK